MNNSEDNEYSDDSSESYASNISPKNISYESEEDEFSDEGIDTDIQHGTWTNVETERPRFSFIGTQKK